MTNTANTILEQLGGNRFIAMTGAKEFVSGMDRLTFSLPRNMSKGNKMRVTLLENDTYQLDVFAVRGGVCTCKRKVEGVYVDQLRSVFTEMTGLETSLGTMGKR